MGETIDDLAWPPPVVAEAEVIEGKLREACHGRSGLAALLACAHLTESALEQFANADPRNAARVRAALARTLAPEARRG